MATMSSAYALWNKSVNVAVSVSSAVIRVDYVGRVPSSSGINCASQPSSSNPLLSIHETGDIYLSRTSTYHTITYTLKNNGTVDIYLYGIEIGPSISYYKTKSHLDKRTSIDYRIIFNSGYSDTETTLVVDATDGVLFTSSTSTDSRYKLEVGETCTLEVTYYLSKNIRRGEYVEITSKIDTPLYVLAR